MSREAPPISAFGNEAPGGGHGLRVLIADDDRDAVAMLAVLLRQAGGHQIREVHRGDGVLDQLSEFLPDVVILDIGMPGMTGYDVARKLRAVLRERCPMLVAVTGWSKGADRVLGKIVGFDHYVTKPYDPNALLELVASARK